MGTLIINSVSKTITFKTKGLVTENDFNVEGITNIKLSDFNIEGGNQSDELPVSFKVSGKPVAPAN